MHIAVVDNSISDAERLIEYIKRYFMWSGVEFNCVHFDDGIKFLDSGLPFDMVFMETDLPYRDGFRIAETMRESDKYISLVFYTSNAEGAIRGYEFDALDYMLKPLDYNNFSVHFQRILKRSRSDVPANDNYLVIKTKKKLVSVLIDDIVFVEVDGHYCVYHLVDKEIKVIDKLAHVAESLSLHNFEYCNACYLVNLKHVSKIELGYVYVGVTCLKMSRSKSKKFSNRLIEYLTKE